MYHKYYPYFRLILSDEEDNDNRLELDNLLQILCFHFVSKASNKFLTKHQSFDRTNLFDNSVFYNCT